MNADQKRQYNRRVKLIKHLRYLQSTEPRAFNLRQWVQARSAKAVKEAIESWPDRFKRGEELNCGTSACVVGHLPLVFPRQFKWFHLPRKRFASVVTRDWGMDAECELYLFFGEGHTIQWFDVIYQSQYKVKHVKLHHVLERIEAMHAEINALTKRA